MQEFLTLQYIDLCRRYKNIHNTAVAWDINRMQALQGSAIAHCEEMPYIGIKSILIEYFTRIYPEHPIHTFDKILVERGNRAFVYTKAEIFHDIQKRQGHLYQRGRN